MSGELKHVTEQFWRLEEREDGIYLVAKGDGTLVLKMCRPDRGSDILVAGYISGLQYMKVRRKPRKV